MRLFGTGDGGGFGLELVVEGGVGGVPAVGEGVVFVGFEYTLLVECGRNSNLVCYLLLSMSRSFSGVDANQARTTVDVYPSLLASFGAVSYPHLVFIGQSV